VIAGPSSAGKSRYIRFLQTSEGRTFMRKLGLSVNSESTIMSGRELEVHPHPLEDLILHYDITRQWKRGFTFEYKRDELLHRVSRFHSITILTIWLPREALVNRHSQRRRTFAGRLKIYAVRTLLYLKLIRNRSVAGLYNDPAEYVRSIPTDCHWLLDCSETDPIPHPVVSF
jgi:hypothetical protein